MGPMHRASLHVSRLNLEALSLACLQRRVRVDPTLPATDVVWRAVAQIQDRRPTTWMVYPNQDSNLRLKDLWLARVWKPNVINSESFGSPSRIRTRPTPLSRRTRKTGGAAAGRPAPPSREEVRNPVTAPARRSPLLPAALPPTRSIPAPWRCPSRSAARKPRASRRP